MGDTNPTETPPEPSLEPVADPTPEPEPPTPKIEPTADPEAAREPEAAADPEPTLVETTPEPPAAYSRPEGKHLYAVLCEAAAMKPDEAVSLAAASPSLDALGPLLTSLCPDVTPVETMHVAAMLAARAEAVGTFPPPSSLPSLQGGLDGFLTHLLAMQKLRQLFWGLRCTITGEEAPASQPADMDGGAKALSPLLGAVRELLRTMDAKFDDIQAKFDAFKPNAKLELNQLGMAQLIKTTMPSLSTEILCYMLVHLDEVVDPTGGRATLNEIFTALKWFTLIVPEATVEDSGNAVDQLSAALAAIEGAVLFKTLATVSADGAVELKAAAFKELAASACHALRPMDVQYLCALVGGRTGWTLEELRAHLDKCRQFKKLLRRTQDLRSGDKQKALAAAGEEADDDQAGLPRLNAINALMQAVVAELKDKTDAVKQAFRDRSLDQVAVRDVVASSVVQLTEEGVLFLVIFLNTLSPEDGLLSFEQMEQGLAYWSSVHAVMPIAAPQQSDVFVVDRLLMSKAAAAGKVWAHFHNVDVDMDGMVSSAELKALLASVSVTPKRDEDFFMCMLELEGDAISQEQLISQLKTVSALRAMYWKQRCELSGEAMPVDVPAGLPSNAFVLKMMRNADATLKKALPTFSAQLAAAPTADDQKRVSMPVLKTALSAVLPDLTSMDMRLILIHLDAVTVANGWINAAEVDLALGWWAAMVGEEPEPAVPPVAEALAAAAPSTPQPDDSSMEATTREQTPVTSPSSATTTSEPPVETSTPPDDQGVVAQFLYYLKQSDSEQWFRAADKDADGRLDVPEVGDLMGMLEIPVENEARRNLFFVAALLEAAGQPIFSMAELQAELAACQAVRWMYWKQRCAMTGEPLPPLYTEFGDGAQPVSISEGLCGVLKCLEANPEKFALLFQRTCDVRGVPDVLDIADVRGLLAQLMPNVPLDVMRVVLTHLDAAISGDGGIQAIDVMDALRWWESADALALQGAPAVA